ncbi:MAG: hypothetical protein CVV39_05825 [Planctomycetes bacterium HGW-Planctomycetes-1]|nr:MAG: hypothetical protein CVV39_05825 [Planctomycetes bacterium HGW-Planctomycetes-1]
MNIMKKWIFAVLVLTVITVDFAEGMATKKPVRSKGPLLLSVDFEPNVPLRYKFVCERQIELDLDSKGRYRKEGAKGRGQVQNYTEMLEMEIVYKAVEIDPYGYSIIEATCQSAKVVRSSTGGRSPSKPDAAETLAGKSFTLKITPTGKAADYSSLEALMKEVGQNAFGTDSKRTNVKDPDMIMDFAATQWGLWDSISSIKRPLKGLKKNSKWTSKLLAPMPFVAKVGRDVKYKLAGIVESNDTAYAEITSSYSLSKSPPENIPMPYSGTFQMRGTFGFLQSYRVLSLEGSGRQLYDIKRGLIKSDIQQYKAEVAASIFGGLGGVEPSIKIDQKITMTLIE